jgi:hypothetical protein
MNSKTFRQIALGMEGAIENAHMGHPDFRANGRIFATLHADNKHGVVKLTPEQQARFVVEHPTAFSPASGAWGRQGYTLVALADVDAETLGEAMTLAWQNLAAAKRPAAVTRKKPGARAARRPVVRKSPGKVRR